MKVKSSLWDHFHDLHDNNHHDNNNKQGVQSIDETCRCCASQLAYSDEGFLACTNVTCSRLFLDLLNHHAEWRYYADDASSTDPTRCGMPINPFFTESSFGCRLICSGSSSYNVQKMRRYIEWHSMPYEEKSRYNDFQRIIVMSQNAGIPKLIVDQAILYHKRISEFEEANFRGDNREAILAASLYIACRMNNYVRTPKEIANIFFLDVTNTTKGCKRAQDILNRIEKDMHVSEKSQLHHTRSDSFIDRYCSRLNVNMEVTRLSQFIGAQIEKKSFLPENTPHSIAAGVVYFVAHLYELPISKRDVSIVSEISEVTINKCFKKIQALTSELVPSVILAAKGIIITSLS